MSETFGAWAETRCWHPADERLRRMGFKIHARPKAGPALWRRGNVIYAEEDAVALCDLELEAVAGKVKR